MGKNKGKNKGGKAQQQFKPSTPVQKITAEVKENTASVEAKLSELEEGNVTPVEVKEELSPESATKLEQAEKKEDVAGYLKYLRELNLRIDAQLARANLIVEEAKTEKESLAEEKKEFENEQKQFRTDRAELEKKDIALKKRAQEFILYWNRLKNHRLKSWRVRKKGLKPSLRSISRLWMLFKRIRKNCPS